jgi:hypothetical protein
MEILALLLATASLLYAIHKLNQKLRGVDYETKFFMTRKEFDEIQDQYDKRLYEISNPSPYDIGQVMDDNIIITKIELIKTGTINMSGYTRGEYKYQYTAFNKRNKGIEIWEE